VPVSHPHPIGASSKADLSRAYLRGAKLWGTDLTKADLSRVDLSEAVLGGAGVRRLERLTLSLEGVTMPNGQKFEDWIKGREGRAEDGKNGSSS
jgi:hypothetical protein